MAKIHTCMGKLLDEIPALPKQNTPQPIPAVNLWTELLGAYIFNISNKPAFKTLDFLTNNSW